MNWEAIRIEFEETDITMKALAEKHGVKPATLRSRKNREKWVQRNAKKVATKNATQRKNVARKKAERIIESNDELKGWEMEFCYEYLKEFNATKAYRTVRDVTYNTAATEGMRTLRKPYIQETIKDIKKETNADLLISVEDIKKEYLKQSFANVNDYVEYGSHEIVVSDKHGNQLVDVEGNPVTYKDSFIHFKDMDEIDGTLIKEVRMGKDGPVIQLYDKQKAMQELLKLMSNDGPGGTEKVVFLSSEEQMEQWIAENGESNDG